VKLPPEFPAELRQLVEDEVRAGNEIAEVGSGFPSPPVGAWVRLARPVSTRARVATAELDFYERNRPDYSGEFADGRRHFFVLEPPLPPAEPPDMDAIRAALVAGAAVPPPALAGSRDSEEREVYPERAGLARERPASLVERFRQSMTMTYERWREGIGYDLDLLAAATADERRAIERLLTGRPVEDWRDVEALAALDTPRARAVLRRALQNPDHRVATSVAHYAPHLVSEAERTATLVAALERADTYGGLTQTLLQVEEFHPPEVMAALWRGLLARDGATAVHFAAMLTFLYGKAESAFDWNQRPFFLRFHTEDLGERARVCEELCERLGVRPVEG